MFWFRRDESSDRGRNAIKPTVYAPRHPEQGSEIHAQREKVQDIPQDSRRNYFTDIPYILPRDAGEARRLDFQHFIVRAALGKNYSIPQPALCSAQMILDVGSGTNIWGHEICREFPSSHIYGLDLEYTMRPEMPNNYRFVKGNVLHRLPFDKNTFHYVHQRFMGYAIPAHDWPAVVDRLLMATVPGGWIELIELGCEYARPVGSVTEQMVDNVRRLAAMRRIDTRVVGSLEGILEQSGMVNIRKKVVPLPVGKWGGRIGTLMATNLNAIITAVREPCLQTFHYTPDYFDQLAATMNREWEERHSMYPVYVYYGQKP